MRSGETGWHLNKQNPHRCDEPNVGGFHACPLCHRHHNVPLSGPRADWCESYPNAPQAKGA